MKKFKFTVLLFVAFGLHSFAQNCTVFEKNMVYKTSGDFFMPMFKFFPAFTKLNAEKREQKVTEYNEKVFSGKTKPFSAGTNEFIIRDVVRDGTGERVLVESNTASLKYSTILACKNDSMYFARTIGTNWVVTKGDTTGFSILGLQVIPNKLKVGDFLSPYEDFGTSVPNKEEMKAKWPQFKGYQTSYHTSTGLDFDHDDNFKLKSGTWETKTTTAVYEDVDVKAKQVMTPSYISKHYINAKVVRTEDITINSKTYTAYVIESETWMKMGTIVSYESENKDFNAYYNNIQKKGEERYTKKFISTGLMNEQGYIVTFLTEWFVPGLGIAKSVAYDSYGLISSRYNMLSLQ